MTRGTATTIAVIIALVIVGVIIWSLSAKNKLDTAQEEYQATSTPTAQLSTPQDISVDARVDTELNQLEQELQGI